MRPVALPIAPLLLLALAVGCRTLADEPATPPSPMPHADGGAAEAHDHGADGGRDHGHDNGQGAVAGLGADADAAAGDAGAGEYADLYEGFLSEVPS